MKHRWWQTQRLWQPTDQNGWRIMYSWRHGWGIGIIAVGSNWTAVRCNGVEFYIGPINLSIQPPTPKWLLETDAFESGNSSST